MEQARHYVTMTDVERQRLDKAMAGLEMGPHAAECVLAEGQVNRFLEALYNHMEADHVTQADLARRMDVQPNQIRRWLSTESSMKASTMFLLARMMGYKLEQDWQPIEAAVVEAHWSKSVSSAGLDQIGSLSGRATIEIGPSAGFVLSVVQPVRLDQNSTRDARMAVAA